MEIKRDIIDKLIRWKDSEGRKPLIIRGARQTGKTWIMKQFGAEHFEYTAFFNFDLSENLAKEFEGGKEPERLIDILRLYTNVPIEPGRTLIVFDEIQQSNKALNSLKYFCEQAPQYHIVAAGSLLGTSLSKGDSFPVGKVDFLQMYPVSFREFLRCKSPKIFDYLESLECLEPLPEIVMTRAAEAFRQYLICGGMPAAASAMLDRSSVEEVSYIQDSILTSYAMDFAKHTPGSDIPRLSAIWNSIPSQLAKENRKFVYKLVKEGARAREYENALLWLDHAGLIHRVFCSSKPGIPLPAYDDVSAFKIYLCDVGLLRRMSRVPAESIISTDTHYIEFKGAMAENVVLQSLVSQFDVMPRYWTSGATAEVDFLLQAGSDVLPIEVKSGTRLSGKSLGVYASHYSPRISLRYSLNNLKMDGAILNIPLFLADWTEKLSQIPQD